jgi:hypothetical protein
MLVPSTVPLASAYLEALLPVSKRIALHNRCESYDELMLTYTPSLGNGALNCVANNQLTCDNAVKERSGVLCRFQLPGGKIQDGAKQITSLSQAKVN